MISLGVPFLDSDFNSFFEYSSNISNIYTILEEVKRYEEFLNEDKYSFIIIHTTLAS